MDQARAAHGPSAGLASDAHRLDASDDMTDIEDCVCPPTRAGVALLRRPTPLAVSVSTLLVNMAGYCEAQSFLRSLNGHALLPTKFIDDHGFHAEEAQLVAEIEAHGEECAAPANSREFASWRRMYARMRAELESVRDTIRQVEHGRRGALRGSVRGPGAAASAAPDAAFERLQAAYAANFVFLCAGSYVHRKLEFADRCFVEHIPSVTRASGVTRHYAAQMLRMIASCINIALLGKANEMPVYMYTRMDYGGMRGCVEHLLSGVIDSVRVSHFGNSRIYVTDYKTHGRVVAQKPEHRAQVWIYMKMLHEFANFPVRHVHDLLLREDGIVDGPSTQAMRLGGADLEAVRHDLRFFLRTINADAAERAWIPVIFTAFRSGFNALINLPSLSFTQIAECAVYCVRTLLAHSSEARGSGSPLYGEVVYYPRERQDYKHRHDGVGPPTRFEVYSCHERSNERMAEDDDDLVCIMTHSFRVTDGVEDLRGPSTRYACGTCEYADSCEYKPE